MRSLTTGFEEIRSNIYGRVVINLQFKAEHRSLITNMNSYMAVNWWKVNDLNEQSTPIPCWQRLLLTITICVSTIERTYRAGLRINTFLNRFWYFFYITLYIFDCSEEFAYHCHQLQTSKRWQFRKQSTQLHVPTQSAMYINPTTLNIKRNSINSFSQLNFPKCFSDEISQSGSKEEFYSLKVGHVCATSTSADIPSSYYFTS